MYGMFFDTYDTPVYRPPSEAASFILRVTRGCAHNNCTYCNMYRGVKFEKLSDEQIMRQIELARATDAEGVRRVFLADGDALVLPTDRLLKILAVLKEYFPNLERVASYAAPGDILRKSVEELTSLRKAGLTLLYYGMESGDSQTLKEIRKGVNGEQSIEVGKRAMPRGCSSPSWSSSASQAQKARSATLLPPPMPSMKSSRLCFLRCPSCSIAAAN